MSGKKRIKLEYFPFNKGYGDLNFLRSVKDIMGSVELSQTSLKTVYSTMLMMTLSEKNYIKPEFGVNLYK